MANITIELKDEQIKNLKLLAAPILHLTLLYFIYTFMYSMGWANQFPRWDNMMFFDAGYYAEIKVNGYHHLADNMPSSTAFFPLFPLFWRITDLSPVAISVFNLLMLYGANIILQRTFKLNLVQSLLLLCIPSMVFCFTPFSEAFFYFFGVIFICGIKKDLRWMILLGMFGMCLTRAASIFFFPCIIFANLLSADNSSKPINFDLKTALVYLAPAILGLFLGAFIQYLDTRVFFSFIQQQGNWGHKWHEFIFPVVTWDLFRLFWIDSSSLFFAGVSGLICLLFLYRYIKFKSFIKDKALLFSLGYLAIYFPYMIFYYGNDSIFSINRYVMASPFFAYLLIALLQREEILFNNYIKELGLLILVSFCVWQLFAFLPLDTRIDLENKKYFFYFFLLTGYLSVFYFAVLKKNNFALLLLSISLVVMQCVMFNWYMNGIWIG